MKLPIKFLVYDYFLGKGSTWKFSLGYSRRPRSKQMVKHLCPRLFSVPVYAALYPHTACNLAVSDYLNGEALTIISSSASFKTDSTTLSPK